METRVHPAACIVLSVLFFLVPALCAQNSAKPRLSVVAGIEAVPDQDGSSAFGAENLQAVLSMVTAYAAESGAYELVAAADREAAIAELEFSLSQLAEGSNQLRLGKMLSAQRVLSARCSKAAEYLVVQLSLVDVETGMTLGSSLGRYRNLGTLLDSLRSLTLGCLGIRDRGEEGQLRFISVRNSTELLGAIGSNRVITLQPGSYDLSQKNDIRHANLAWKDNYDGFYPIVKSVENLTIQASGDAEILISPSYGWVFEFQTSRNLRFRGIRFAHRKPGYCLGGVLRFELCEGIEITECSLDGSGTYGLELDRSRGLSMEASAITNCTYGIMQVNDSSDLRFSGCSFTDNREFDLIAFSGSSNADFADCEIAGNSGSSLLSVDGSSFNIGFERCRIADNEAPRDFLQLKGVRFRDCRYE
jgi:hypothetical protein